MDADDYTAVVHGLAAQFGPRSVLCIGAGCEQLFAGQSGLVQLAGEPGLAQRLTGLGRFDLAYVGPSLERLEPREAMTVLARLRDVHAPRIIAALTSAGLPDHALLALGFTLPPARGARLALFDITDYKFTPDWLNARFWAHPERWDQGHG